jgi:group II intron reverse transcriptase/maturase
MQSLESFFTQESLSDDLELLLKSHFDVIDNKPRISIGADKIDLKLFFRDRDKHLRAIERKVTQGRYTFSPFLEHEIPKVDSKVPRTISISSIRDTIVQRGVYKYLNQFVEPLLSDSVFGYRKGRSAHDAVRLIQNHFSSGLVHVFDADLSKFFDEIDHELLVQKVANLPNIDERVEKLVFRFIKTGKVPSPQVKEFKNQKGKQQKYRPEARLAGVPQGGVLSGVLSNLFLAEFDFAIEQNQKGFVRYADDFVICCETREECLALREVVRTELPKGAKLNEEKTTDCVDAESGVDFLGFRILPETLRIRGRNVGKFKSRISGLIRTQRVHKSWQRTLKHLVYRLRFKIQGPLDDQLQALADLGYSVAPYHRSWIGFFRIATDVEQVRNIDRWIRKQISEFVWRNHRVKITLSVLQEYDLPTLVNTQFRARRSRRIEPSGNEADVFGTVVSDESS